MERFKDWCPEVRKLCAMTGEYLKWKLADFDQLDHWVSESGKVALVGDACHPMMPYMAQGAAQATEDAACIAACLRTHSSVAEALAKYEELRKPRTTYIARNTRVLQEWLHLYDGPARNERDAMMKGDEDSNPIFWGWSRNVNVERSFRKVYDDFMRLHVTLNYLIRLSVPALGIYPSFLYCILL